MSDTKLNYEIRMNILINNTTHGLTREAANDLRVMCGPLINFTLSLFNHFPAKLSDLNFHPLETHNFEWVKITHIFLI